MILQLPEGRDLFQTGCVGTGGDFEDCMNRRTRPLHCEVMIQRHMKICKLSSQTNSNNEGSNFPAVRLEKLPTKFPVSNSPNPTLIILTSTSLGLQHFTRQQEDLETTTAFGRAVLQPVRPIRNGYQSTTKNVHLIMSMFSRQILGMVSLWKESCRISI